MNILLTNDDGYNSQGILLMKKLLSKYGRVVICAPKTGMSAKSCSITIHSIPIYVDEEEKDVFSCSGTPADCVCFALSSLSIDFDLVVSGCNHGLNISLDTMYSGTIGACLEALKFFKPTFAVSTYYNYDIVEKYFDDVYHFITDNKLIGNEYLLNINFPKGDKVKDIKLSTLYYRHDNNYYVKEGDGYCAYRHTDKQFPDENNDCYMAENDIVSITPLSRSYYQDNLYNELKKKCKRKD